MAWPVCVCVDMIFFQFCGCFLFFFVCLETTGVEAIVGLHCQLSQELCLTYNLVREWAGEGMGGFLAIS